MARSGGGLQYQRAEMSKSFEKLGMGDLDPADEVRQQFEASSKPTAHQPVRPTSAGLSEPPQSKNFCPKCGSSQSEPFGNYKAASSLYIHGVRVEVYPDGGVIIYSERDVTVSTRKSSGPGTSGRLGYTRVCLFPDR